MMGKDSTKNKNDVNPSYKNKREVVLRGETLWSEDMTGLVRKYDIR
jgi:hypothetical protein